MLDLKALPVLRRNMAAFIAADPLMISLIRTPLVETAAAGYVKGSPVTLAPQQFRLGTFKRRLTPYTAITANGQIPVMSYILIGRYTADIQRDDEFYLNGDHYTVISIEPKTDDRSRSDCVEVELWFEQGDKNPPVGI